MGARIDGRPYRIRGTAGTDRCAGDAGNEGERRALLRGDTHTERVRCGTLSSRPEVVDAVAAAFLIFGASNLGYLGGALASNRVSNLLSPRGFGQALIRLVVGEVAVVVGLLYAFLQISAMSG